MFYQHPAEANGYLFVTSDDDPARDPTRWRVWTSADNGTSWVAKGASVWHLNWQGSIELFPGMPFDTPTGRGVQASVRSQLSWT